MKKNTEKICAIICEFNPMHTGHVYLVNQAKEITGAKYMLGLMSGNFSQRSEPCVLDKYNRAEIAVQNGFDLMLGLPTAFCTNNAEVFALSSIKILNSLNIDYLAFGMETTNLNAINKFVDFLLNETEDFKKELKKHLQNGLSYNQSLINTIKNNIKWFDKNIQKDIEDLVSLPNNILAIEYLKALKRTKSKIQPVIIKRVNNYNSNEVINNYVSASFIRENLTQKKLENIKKFLPHSSLKYYTNMAIDFNLFHNLILYKLKSMKLNEIKNIYAVSEGLENKIKKLLINKISFEDFFDGLCSKRYKQSKLNSILLNSLLNINKQIIKKLYTIKSNINAKILAINGKNGDILSKINSKMLISRKTDANKIKDKFNKELMQIEQNANIIYNLISSSNLLENDYYNKMKVVRI